MTRAEITDLVNSTLESGGHNTATEIRAALLAISASVFNTQDDAAVQQSMITSMVNIAVAIAAASKADTAALTALAAVVGLKADSSALAAKAPSDSPTFTTAAHVPTVATISDDTNAASTAFVKAVVAATTAGVATVNGRSGAITLSADDVNLNLVDNIASANMPVSTAQATAIANAVGPKADVSTVNASLANKVTIGQTQEEIKFGADNGTGIIPTNTRYLIPIGYACVIQGWNLVADVPGSITVDLRKGTPSGGSVTTASITASATPSLSSAQFSSSDTLTGWTTTVAAGDCLEMVVTGTPTLIHRFALTLKIIR